MAFHFIIDVDKKWCVGNTLSTMSANFISLDTNLYNLSSYSVSSINFLQTEVSQLSTQFVSASAFLQTEVNYLSTQLQSVSGNLQTQINFASSNVINNYIRPQTLTQNSDGTISFDFSKGTNARVAITKNGFLNNPNNTFDGDSGSLMVTTATSGALITGFGGTWTCGDATSAFTYSFGSSHLISYFYDNNQGRCVFNVINY